MTLCYYNDCKNKNPTDEFGLILFSNPHRVQCICYTLCGAEGSVVSFDLTAVIMIGYN